VDVPLIHAATGTPVLLRVPPYRLRLFLAQVDEPSRLLEVEDAEQV